MTENIPERTNQAIVPIELREMGRDKRWHLESNRVLKRCVESKVKLIDVYDIKLKLTKIIEGYPDSIPSQLENEELILFSLLDALDPSWSLFNQEGFLPKKLPKHEIAENIILDLKKNLHLGLDKFVSKQITEMRGEVNSILDSFAEMSGYLSYRQIILDLIRYSSKKSSIDFSFIKNKEFLKNWQKILSLIGLDEEQIFSFDEEKKNWFLKFLSDNFLIKISP